MHGGHHVHLLSDLYYQRNDRKPILDRRSKPSIAYYNNFVTNVANTSFGGYTALNTLLTAAGVSRNGTVVCAGWKPCRTRSDEHTNKCAVASTMLTILDPMKWRIILWIGSA